MEKKTSRRVFFKELTQVLAGGIGGGLAASYLISENKENTRKEMFRYLYEIPQILKHAKRIGVEPELLMAIRSAENGRDELAYGIMPRGKAKELYERDRGYTLNDKFYEYTDEKEKQLCWACWTVKKNFERFNINSEGYDNFISYLASKYAPLDAENDPEELNRNWERNVRFFYKNFKNSLE